MKGQTRQRRIQITVATVAIVAGVLVAERWWTTPILDFPSERVRSVENVPAFSPGGMIAEERVSIANEVRRRTWRPIARVIVDDRVKPFPRAYAFVGSTQGLVYVLRPAGVDGWEIVREDKWGGEPQTYILRQSYEA